MRDGCDDDGRTPRLRREHVKTSLGLDDDDDNDDVAGPNGKFDDAFHLVQHEQCRRKGGNVYKK